MNQLPKSWFPQLSRRDKDFERFKMSHCVLLINHVCHWGSVKEGLFYMFVLKLKQLMIIGWYKEEDTLIGSQVCTHVRLQCNHSALQNILHCTSKDTSTRSTWRHFAHCTYTASKWQCTCSVRAAYTAATLELYCLYTPLRSGSGHVITFRNIYSKPFTCGHWTNPLRQNQVH